MESAEEKLGSSFKWYNATQFSVALNDNVFKLLLILFLIDLKGEHFASSIAIAGTAIFVIPFILFSAFTGRLADRHSKSNIIVAAKISEVILMLLGTFAFWQGNVVLLYAVLFMTGLQSTFFSPAKYGVIAELVKTEHLTRANSFVEALTFIAIIIGTAMGPFLSQISKGNFIIAGLACSCIAAAGLATSLQITKTVPAGGENKASVLFIRDIWRSLWSIHRKKGLFSSVIGAAFFLMFGAFIYINVIPYGIQQFSWNEDQSGYLFVLAGIGIGLGAYMAGKFSQRGIELGIVPLGMLLLAGCSITLGLIRQHLYWALVMVFVVGLGAGLFIVPVHTYIQLKSPKRRRSEIIAASNFLGWIGVLAASGIMYLLSELLMLSAAKIFLILGLTMLVLTITVIIQMPVPLLNFLLSRLMRLCYRMKVHGIENVPTDRGAVLVCNHVSYADALLLNATQYRPIRFIMDGDFYEKKLLKPFCKLGGAIPLPSDDSPRKIIHALKQARNALEKGQIVCIFAEGAMTRNGNMQSFKNGFERIVKGTNFQIIPTYIGGMWGSVFSYYFGRPLSKLPRRFPYPVSIHFGKAVSSNANAEQIRQKITELSCDYYNLRKRPSDILSDKFIKTARRYWFKRCISDSTGKNLNYGKTLIGSIALSGELTKLTESEKNVGIMLPSSVGAALTNIAVTMLGKVTVNLNFTLSHQNITSAINQCDIKCIITSKHFLKKMKNLDSLPHLVFLEDIAEKINLSAKLKAILKAVFIPRKILTGAKHHNCDDIATIIFSSGSSGEPKGIMLSHHNIISNIEAMKSVFKIYLNDNLCAVLPFFHSFGFTCSLWLPIISAVSASYVTTPLDGSVVGKTARKNKSTILFAAPTFLLNYLRRTESKDFSTLRSVITGAEKLKKSITDSFEQKFAIRPLQGYGATELSPVVSLNLQNVTMGGLCQRGSKENSVGHPIPGVAVKVVDLETGQTSPANQVGQLMVKGPNVMQGYLKNEKETAKVLMGNWYNTGDIASIDRDGFITITDRLARFSKIAGEMVPHIGIEEVYHKGLNATEQVVAVTAVEHPNKGEQLVVLHLDKAGNPDKLHDIITNSNLPNIYKPKRNNYIKIESIPTLGSGKLDLVNLRKLASEKIN